jgi:hypothetical protein
MTHGWGNGGITEERVTSYIYVLGVVAAGAI